MCTLSAPVTVTLPMDPAAPRAARAFMATAHCPAHGAAVLEPARLLVSELVSNAVRHGSPPITMAIECEGTQGMRVRVSDADPGAPVVRDADHDAESGRGMALVDLLSDAWGVEPGEAGKAVWFRISGDRLGVEQVS